MSIILSRTRQKATDVSQSESLSQRLCDIASMLDGAKDTLEWLDEVEDAQDAQELLDICECLADATTCRRWMDFSRERSNQMCNINAL